MNNDSLFSSGMTSPRISPETRCGTSEGSSSPSVVKGSWASSGILRKVAASGIRTRRSEIARGSCYPLLAILMLIDCHGSSKRLVVCFRPDSSDINTIRLTVRSIINEQLAGIGSRRGREPEVNK
jgi:hypothetical protein